MVTSKGKTNIPGKIRRAFRIKLRDHLEDAAAADQVSIRVPPGIRALKGALASDKGRGMSFADIREAAAAERRDTRRARNGSSTPI
jgi:bifunctional DNA-binding transcriptional regulator/antitoxin component of YhaV-PrlF toxin-antitoxin module